jgi:hypothetical protein
MAMSKGMRRLIPGRSAMGRVVLLVLSGLLVTVVACKDLSADTSASVYVNSAAHTGGTAVPAETDTVLESNTETASTPKSAAPSTEHEDLLPTGTTTTTIFVAATSMAQPVARWTRFEEDDPRLLFEGAWFVASSPDASGGSYRQITHDQPHNQSVTLRFEGTRVRLVAYRMVQCGYGRVLLDGAEFWVDYFSLYQRFNPLSELWVYSRWYNQIVWTSPVLASGTHQLLLERTDFVNPAAYDYVGSPMAAGIQGINFDAVDVFGGTLISPID